MKKAVFLLFSVVFLASCSKDDVSPVSGQLDQVSEADYAKEIARRYLEFACTAQYDDGRWFAGTLCKEGQGNCKKKRVCTPVTTSSSFTQNDLWDIAEEHVNQGIADGYFDPEGYESLLPLAHDAAVLQYEINQND